MLTILTTIQSVYNTDYDSFTVLYYVFCILYSILTTIQSVYNTDYDNFIVLYSVLYTDWLQYKVLTILTTIQSFYNTDYDSFIVLCYSAVQTPVLCFAF